ncbi:hypothetical protein D3C81_2331480 [compost metagenome]
MGGGGLLLLVLDVADIEHEPHWPTLLAQLQQLALQAIPDRRLELVASLQAHTE